MRIYEDYGLRILGCCSGTLTKLLAYGNYIFAICPHYPTLGSLATQNSACLVFSLELVGQHPYLSGHRGMRPFSKGTLLGTPNRELEPQEYSRNIMEYKDPGRYIPIIYLLYS